MIIEMLGAWMLASGGLYLAIFKEPNDKKKIAHIFKNIGFGFKDKYPILIYEHKKPTHTVYGYSLPYGLLDTPKLEVILEKTLNRPVDVEVNGTMKIKVYKNKDIPKWDYEEVPHKKGWVVPIGRSRDELVWHNFDHTPHMTIAGTTRFGKTVMLKNFMTYLIEHHPMTVEFYIIDLKGGLEFHRYKKLKQVKDVAGNPKEAADMLNQVWSDLENQMKYFKERNLTNITNSPIRKRTFILVDEGGQLMPKKGADEKTKKMLHYCMETLQEICRVGGALGFRHLYATQYPTADSLPKHVKLNSDAKISFRLGTGYASEVAIDEYGAEQLEGKGRAIYKTHDRVEVQVPMLEDKAMWERLRRFEDASKGEAIPEGEENPLDYE